MIDDPLGLKDHPTPASTLAERVAPKADIVNLHKRITGNSYADSMETRLLLLAHLVFLIYADLKETTAE